MSQTQERLLHSSASGFVRLALLIALPVFGSLSAAPRSALAQPGDTPIASESAFVAGCNGAQLKDSQVTAREDPIWTPIIQDPSYPAPYDQPIILEGTVATPDQKFGVGAETSNSQAPSEVAEEDLPWNHYTHDKTIDVIPDPGYKHLLSYWVNPDGSTQQAYEMEVEWENASLMQHDRTWGSEPEFVWPSVSDRVWVTGRWVFDCGHVGSTWTAVFDKDSSGTFSAGDVVIAGDSAPLYHFDPTKGVILPTPYPLRPVYLLEYVETDGNSGWDPGETIVYDTNNDGAYDAGDRVVSGTAPALGAVLEHDFRLSDTLKSFPVAKGTFVRYSTEIHPPRGVVTFRLNHPTSGDSWLPVTGLQTTVPVTEADMFFSGNGGGANDHCSLVNRHINAVEALLSFGLLGIDPCTHTGPVIPINDRNYVFDIYPPGTDFKPRDELPNGTYPVTAPTADSWLQWRTIDEEYQLPAHACGGPAQTSCVTVTPLLCPVDASTPAPDQTETSCPPLPAHPTRLRVILPFKGAPSNAVVAQSILLGWDDVPTQPAHKVRTFRIRLDELDVVHNGEGSFVDGDWRVFVDVGGQWRYMSPIFDRDSSGKNACHGDSLTENGDGDCFRFDDSPWQVSVQDGTPIHVAVGGFESDAVDSDFCRTYLGCDPGTGSAVDLALANDDRIGTYEFDLFPPSYASPGTITPEKTNDGEQYSVTFKVHEVPPPTPPASGPLGIGDPHYSAGSGTTYVSSRTPLNLSTAYTGNVGFQYRYHRDGTALPVYVTVPFPIHWASTDFVAGPRSVPIVLNQNDGTDGPYTVQYSAQTGNGLTEPRHTAHVTLDDTSPTIAISQPAATTYTHSDSLTLDYAASDGMGSGLKSATATIDGSTTVGGQVLQSGQTIDLLTNLSLGDHTFAVTALDNVDNTATRSVVFTIVVTAQSIQSDVQQFMASDQVTLDHGDSLLKLLQAAAAARSAGNCTASDQEYGAFINELDAQDSKMVDAAATQIMIADAQYLIAHCP